MFLIHSFRYIEVIYLMLSNANVGTFCGHAQNKRAFLFSLCQNTSVFFEDFLETLLELSKGFLTS